MVKEEIKWLHSSKCKYCGYELGFLLSTERIICKNCGKVNYKSKKIKFMNKLKRKILEEKRK